MFCFFGVFLIWNFFFEVMSDELKYECGIVLVRFFKLLEYYKEKYGIVFYGVNKMYFMMEK